MARSRQFEEETALRQALEAFWRRGYEATSYAELMAATGLGKGSLYAAFGDKRQLYLRALALYIAREVAYAGALLKGEGGRRPQPAAQRLKTFLSFPIAAVETRNDRRGCFLCNAAIEQAPEDPEVAALVAEGMGEMRDAIETAVKELCEGDPSKAPSKAPSKPANSPSKDTAEHLLALYFGLRVMARGGLPAAQLKRARDAGLLSIGR